MNKNCTRDDSGINESSEDEENAQEDIGSHRNLSNQSFDGAIAAQTVTSMPPIVPSFMRQCPVSALDGTKGDRQAPPPVISNGHRAVPGELLTSHKNPLPSLQTLEHGPKETSQSIFTHTSPLTEVRVDPSSLHSRPDAPATPLALDSLRPVIIRGIGAPTEPSLGRFFGNPQPDPGHILGHPRRYGRLRRR
jgi:hypothetical protein